jgi:[ribosomal protein S5]-alanine N-acetyltransferase
MVGNKGMKRKSALKIVQPVFTNDDFILRPIRKNDEASLQKNINNKKISRNMTPVPYPYTRKHARIWIGDVLKKQNKNPPEELQLVIEIDGEVAGVVGLNRIENYKTELGYWLAEKHWGKGIMTKAANLLTKYAFNELKLKRVYALVMVQNKGSSRVLEKLGFSHEGILKKHSYKNGKFIDMHIYGKVR